MQNADQKLGFTQRRKVKASKKGLNSYVFLFLSWRLCVKSPAILLKIPLNMIHNALTTRA